MCAVFVCVVAPLTLFAQEIKKQVLVDLNKIDSSDSLRTSSAQQTEISSERRLAWKRYLIPSADAQIQNLIMNRKSLVLAARGGDVSGGGNNFIDIVPLRLGDDEIYEFKRFQNEILGVSSLHETGLTGKTYRIAVVDSGVSPNATVNQNVILFKDFTSSCAKEERCDESLHGTLVTDLIAQAAPAAEVISLKVLNRQLKGSIDHLIDALKWIQSNSVQLNIKVINLSLTSEENLKTRIY